MININNIEWNKLTAEDVKKQIEKTEIHENFFIEFKNSMESNSKMMKEISAFANTFGGYIFIGIEDDKTITGRGNWTEERLHTTIHDSISPSPIFDVKEFVIDNQSILLVRIEEGTMPPYIVNDGRIYERISSGSYTIKDSAKLNQLYTKRHDFDNKISSTIELEPLDKNSKWFPQNLCAYLDIGFFIMCRDELMLLRNQEETSFLEKVASVISEYTKQYNISIVGNRIVITLAYTTGHDQNGNELSLDGGIQNFIEVMDDGSVRLRILLSTKDNSKQASITGIDTLLYCFREIYSTIVGNDFDKHFVYAQKYERLTVLRQFAPYYSYNGNDSEETKDIYDQLEKNHVMKYGDNNIVIGNRSPANGYLLLNNHWFDQFKIDWETNSIIQILFRSQFQNLGFVEKPSFNTD